MKPTHILYIHGGMTFKSKKDYIRFLRMREVSLRSKTKWSDAYLDKKLGERFLITRPRMPCSDNAKYEEWAVHFERYIPLLPPNSILIGESLGGIFLAKYLSEHRFPKTLRSVYLVCPPFDNTLPNEDLVGGFTLKSDLSLLRKNCKRLYLLFSKNDPVVPPIHAKKFASKLPDATIIVHDHIQGHFDVTEFPDIVRLIKNDVARKR